MITKQEFMALEGSAATVEFNNKLMALTVRGRVGPIEAGRLTLNSEGGSIVIAHRAIKAVSFIFNGVLIKVRSAL